MQMGTESTEPKVLLIGDSHAQASYYGLNKLCEDLNVPGVYLASIILPYWDRYHYLGETYFYNREKAEALIKWLEANPCITHVIISQFWRARLEVDEYIHWDNKREKMTEDLYFNSLREFLQRIKKLNRHVILVGPGPEIKDNALCRSIRLGARKGNSNINLAPISCTREDIIQLNKHITPMLMQLQKENLCTVLDTFGYIPEDKPFVAYKNGIFLMSDDDHMTGAGSTELYQYLKPQLEKALQQSMPVTETP